jgi:F-type H+-transporting ATPase subunit delta
VEFQHLAADANDERIATVHTARALDDSERERLVTALSHQYDRTVHLQVVVDPEVIGGLRVEIGDDVIDGTVTSRLEDAQRRLVG